ncbi:MAG TPA: hypothetical protein VK753_13080, partial [Xanthomonadaceae bacterium]|nr:hypothetical protein [Xanthomonadaceae bacterium]
MVWTQLQQVVLAAILSQEAWKLDLIFVREGMPLLVSIARSARVVVLPNISYSARAIRQFRRAGSDLILPALEGMTAYRCLTWTLENPLARFVFARSACKSIVLFEDGTGSYMNRGRFGWRHGLKYVMTKAFIHIGLSRALGLRTTAGERDAEYYCLYPKAMKSGTNARAVRIDSYREALLDANA